MKKTPPRSSHGFTLIEVAIVVGVFAIIVAGIWMLVNVLYERTREHEASLQIQTIVRNFRQLYSRVGELGTDPAAGSINYTVLLDTQDAIPQEMRARPGFKEGKVNHPWSTSTGGTLTINDVPSVPDKFELHLIALPKKACSALAVRFSSGELTGLSQVKIDSGGCYGTDAGCAHPLPVSLTDADRECRFNNNSTGVGQNDIIVRLSIRQ